MQISNNITSQDRLHTVLKTSWNLAVLSLGNGVDRQLSSVECHVFGRHNGLVWRNGAGSMILSIWIPHLFLSLLVPFISQPSLNNLEQFLTLTPCHDILTSAACRNSNLLALPSFDKLNVSWEQLPTSSAVFFKCKLSCFVNRFLRYGTILRKKWRSKDRWLLADWGTGTDTNIRKLLSMILKLVYLSRAHPSQMRRKCSH